MKEIEIDDIKIVENVEKKLSMVNVPAVKNGYDQIKDLGAGINFLKNASVQNEPDAFAILKRWREYLTTRIAQIDEIMRK